MVAQQRNVDLRKKRSLFKREWLWAYALIAPTIIGLCILNIYPFFDSIYTSLFKSQGLGPMKYVGLDNYKNLFSDASTWQITLNTLLYMVYTVPIGIFISLILAALLNTKIKGRDVYRGIYFLPMVVASAAVAMVWRWMFNAENGILNQVLGFIGIAPVNWLSNPKVALISCAIIGIWSAIGYDLVMILSGLQGISRTYYEAAQIDGASGVQQFFYITIPLISPTLFFVIIMRVMASIKQFDTIYLLIKSNNPAYTKTATLMVHFYREAFEKFNKGYASSIVIYSTLIIGILTLIQFRGEKYFVHYDD